MRTRHVPHAAELAAVVVMLAIPSSAYALTSGQPRGRVPLTRHPVQQRPRHPADRHRPRHPRPQPVRFHIVDRVVDTVAGRPATVHGWLVPGAAGRTVRLLAGAGRGWAPLATARTGRYGGFTLRYVLSTTGTRWLRVSFGGDHFSKASTAPAGSTVALTARVASWYVDAGSTACGFHAFYGVASRTLPCGTHVTLSYQGRSVTATVDDRGPYVYGRDYDLNQNTAAALGMYGVATVLASA